MNDTKLIPMSPDEIRSKIIEQFTAFQPHMQAYHEYAGRIGALSVEYHNARLSEVLGVPIEEGVILGVLDARETPKNLDEFLAKLSQQSDAKIKRIIFDRVKATYSLFI